jgi:RNA polymerase sigma-70 factor (ECF subfamily)
MDVRIYAAVLRHARRVLPADPALDAEDLCQGAYLKTLGRLDPARSEHEQVTYLCRALDQVAIDAARRKRLATVDTASVPECADPRRDTEGEALARAAEDEWAARLVALGPLYGPALALVYAGGMSYSASCAILGIPQTTLKMRLYRARKHLKETLA